MVCVWLSKVLCMTLDLISERFGGYRIVLPVAAGFQIHSFPKDGLPNEL